MTSPLVSTTELAVSLSSSEPPVLLDVRWRLGGPPGREYYERGHLPGAVFLDLDTDLAAPPGPAGRHPLPEPADLQRVLRAAGVREGGPVVAYDADNGSVAARLWWLLRWAGHDQVRVLDGGYAAWVAEGHPVTTEVPTPAPGDVTVRPGHMPVLDADGAAELARTGVLLDARAPERYRGDVEPIDPKAGHVPGARNAPFASHTGENGRWRTPEELAHHFAQVGVPSEVGGPGEAQAPAAGGTGAREAADASGAGRSVTIGNRVGGDAAGGEAAGGRWPVGHEADGRGRGRDAADEEETGDVVAESSGAGGVRIGAYCGSGVTASSVVLALEVAGITTPDAPAALYAGSWSNWSSDPGRAVATGDDAG